MAAAVCYSPRHRSPSILVFALLLCFALLHFPSSLVLLPLLRQGKPTTHLSLSIVSCLVGWLLLALGVPSSWIAAAVVVVGVV